MNDTFMEKRFAVNPHLTINPLKQGYLVSSPLQTRRYVFSAPEIAALLRFTDGGEVNAVWPHLLDAASTANNDRQELGAYLLLQNFIQQGLLVEELMLSPEQIGNLHFSGHSATSPKLFESLGLADTAVRIGHLPVSDVVNDPERTLSAAHPYPRLLKNLAGDSSAHVLEPLRRLVRTLRAAKDPQALMLTDALQICRRPDGEFVLLGSGTKAATARALGLKARALLLPPADFIAKLVDAPHTFFGTMRGAPYQTVYLQGQPLLPGLRPDLNERLAKVRTHDIVEKRILDLGCNIGMNCYLAVERGASHATGIDLPNLIGPANRLNAFYGYACHFVAGDLNRAINDIAPCDTVFVFALLGHLDNMEGLLHTIKASAAKTVYFETHIKSETQDSEDRFLASDFFTTRELLGSNTASCTADDNETRRFYRLEVAQ